MLDFEMCDYGRIPAEDAQPILFDYLCFLDSTLDPADRDSVTSRIPGGEETCAEFMGASDEKLFKLAQGFKQSNKAARLTILWYLSCCGYANAQDQFMQGLHVLHKSYRHSGQSLVKRIRQAIASWEEDMGAWDSILIEDDDRMPTQVPVSTPPPPEGRVVCAAIGDAGSRDGQELERRYRSVLGKSLPMKGILGDVHDMHQALVERFPWARNVVDTVCGQLSLIARGHRDDSHVILPPILIVGAPGSGKTRILHDICELLSLPYCLVPCGGTTDSGGLLPVARGWATNRACGPVQAMLEKKCANPGVILDEIDKASVESKNGSVCGALLSMMNGDGTYYDACLMNNVDLGAVSFLATANSLERIPEALKDRFMVIEMANPDSSHFDKIFEGIAETEARRLGISVADLPELDELEKDELKSILDFPGASIRMVERAFRTLCGDKALGQHLELEQAPFGLGRHMSE
ncbi:AAA family ATPase [Salipiger mucosus]|uniref:Putative ATP-dependent protease La n=1 Tax=Salipiger mucosus DSM 16094 TaxID=1123237 RepID=S9RVP3_9RHOB|nr:AAA family ATPase [Salipiger mucosus]EPX78049.1 putative ATP-dependent protease La [Salipiger mucosus DSM 16094]